MREPTEFKVRIERTDSDEGYLVTITLIPPQGRERYWPGPQTFGGDGMEWVRDLIHDWMVDNIV